VSAVTEEVDGYIAITNKGTFEVTARGVASLLPEHWNEWFKSGLVGAGQGRRSSGHRDLLRWGNGLRFFRESSLANSSQIVEGRGLFSATLLGGFLIGSAGGLYVLQDRLAMGSRRFPTMSSFAWASASESSSDPRPE